MTQIAELAARVLDDPERWPQDPKEAVALQRRLADRVREEPLDVDGVGLVAGLDVSYAKNDPALAAAAVVMDARTLEQFYRKVSNRRTAWTQERLTGSLQISAGIS